MLEYYNIGCSFYLYFNIILVLRRYFFVLSMNLNCLFIKLKETNDNIFLKKYYYFS